MLHVKTSGTAFPDDCWKCRQLTSRVAAHVCSHSRTLPFALSNTLLLLVTTLLEQTWFVGQGFLEFGWTCKGMLELIHPHAVRYISIPYVRWCMLMYLEVSRNQLLEKGLLGFQPWMEFEVLIQICVPFNRTFLGWLTPSRMARNVLLSVHGREFQYKAQIETNTLGDATVQNQHGSNQCQLGTMQLFSCTLSCVYHAPAAWHSAGTLWLSSILPTQTLCQWMFGHLARRSGHFISNVIGWLKMFCATWKI